MNKLECVNNIDLNNIYNKICERIESAKINIAIKVNNEVTLLYWNIGKDITERVLNNEKAEYGKSTIKELSKKLTIQYGQGYSMRNIFKMLQFYEYFPDFEILPTLSAKLSWSHFVELLQIKDKLKREFYVTMCMNENWSVRTLRQRIDSALFERTAISKKPEQTIINDLKLLNDENKMTTELFFRDPYILDFLDLKDTYSESDLENAIIRELEKFKPEHKGQVELYLKWLDKYEKAEGEESPIAIILCATKSNTMTELLGLENSGIHVAQYLTKYVPKEVLEEKFLSSIKNAKIQLEQRKVKNTSAKSN